jgi:hypothetical protein
MLLLLAILVAPTHGSVMCGAFSCKVGTYCPTTTSGCKACPIGKFTPAMDSPQCMPCAAGSVQPKAGQSSCTACKVGQYQDDVTQTACIKCPGGKFQAKASQPQCDRCPHGRFSNKGWFFCDSTCRKGTYESGKATCNACTPGKFQPKPGQKSCVTCPVGKFSNDLDPFTHKKLSGSKAAIANCFSCVLGQQSYNSFTGGKQAGTECRRTGQPCHRGKFGLNGGFDSAGANLTGLHKNMCHDCPVGKYQAHHAKHSCKVCNCPAGRFRQPSLGNTWCHCRWVVGPMTS